MLAKLRNHPIIMKMMIFFSILGPGIVTGSVDNDAGGITTYSVAGAMHGYNMIWALLPAFVVLIVVQEMNARMGLVTGKGLADLIRENAGVKATFFIFLGLLCADIGNTTTEFAGIAGSTEVFGISRYFSVPFAGILVWILVVKGTYQLAERIFLVLSAALLSYVISALLGKPQWAVIGHAVIHPNLQWDGNTLAMVIGIVGTTIAPWMLFYMQSAVIEKKLKITQYRYTLIDVILGAFITVVVAFFIMVACASTLHAHGVQIEEAKDAAKALEPLAGELSSAIFAFGLFAASIFSATILPLAASYYICEAFGFEAGIDKKWREAQEFYVLYTGMIVISMLIILIPNAPLIRITLWSQILNGLFLPIVLICMMILINRSEVMGNYKNKTLSNWIGWGTVSLLLVLTLFFFYRLIY